MQVRPCGAGQGILPGTALKMLLLGLSITGDGNCGCDRHALQMNMWGENAAEHRDEIVSWLKESANKRGWAAKIAAGVELLQHPWFNALDPYGSIVVEAIRRAKAAAESSPQPPPAKPS